MGPKTTQQRTRATRYVETRYGILNYQKLVPLLAKQVLKAEVAVLNGELSDLAYADLLLELHNRIAADIVPKIAGRWRIKDVQVGSHKAPPSWEVPSLMRNYSLDLSARLAADNAESDSGLIETLVFAEGQLLHIHPFEDFNGRVSRLFLTELLRRLNLPTVEFEMNSDTKRNQYFAALSAYDQHNRAPLTDIWYQRLREDVP